MTYRNPFLGDLGRPAMRFDVMSEPAPLPAYTSSSSASGSATGAAANSAPIADKATRQAAQLLQPTADARILMLQSPSGLTYPAANGTTDLLTYTVPSGSVLVVQSLAIVNVGPEIIDYSGNALYHVLRNGAAVRGYANLLAQLGTLSQPQGGINMIFEENQNLSITVSVPNGKAIPAGNVPAARLIGFLRLAPQRTNIFAGK